MDELSNVVRKAFKSLEHEMATISTVVQDFCLPKMKTEDLSYRILQNLSSKTEIRGAAHPNS